MFTCSGKVQKGGMESVNRQNDNKTASKKWTDKKKRYLFFVFCKCV